MRELNFFLLLLGLPLRRLKKKHKPKGYWTNTENRMKFFTEFAKANGFDPWDVEQWKGVTTGQVLAAKVSSYSLVHIFFVNSEYLTRGEVCLASLKDH